MSKVSFLGAGSWGTALAVMLAKNGHDVTMWSAIADELDMLVKNREHKLPASIRITGDLEEACTGTGLLVFAVASPYVRETAKKAARMVAQGQCIVNVAKGIENDSLLTLCDVIAQEIPHAEVAVLSGPSHAEEVAVGIPTTVVAGSKRQETARMIQEVFMNDRFRVYTSSDMTGIELGGAIKNVIALAAGIIDGLGFGDNTKAALMTRGITEISRLGVRMGGNMETFTGLSGIGDLIVTCTSEHSRNHTAGYLIGKGYTTEAAIKEVGQVVEGVHSAKAALALADKYHVSMPIVEQINKVLFDGQSVADAVHELLVRDRCDEYPDLGWQA